MVCNSCITSVTHKAMADTVDHRYYDYAGIRKIKVSIYSDHQYIQFKFLKLKDGMLKRYHDEEYSIIFVFVIIKDYCKMHNSVNGCIFF